ncbi:MAG: PA14 domain-containing protein [Chloroflexota bacterium]
MSAWLLGAASIAANLGALVLFASERQLDAAWLLYAASVVGVVIALDRASPGGCRSLAFEPPRGELLALAAIVLVAVAFRFYLIGTTPFGLWSGEAQSGLLSERILTDPSFRPVWLTDVAPGPAFKLYWQAGVIFLLGPTRLSLRLLPAVAGVLGVLAAYLLGRELFGWRTGLVAGALLAVSSWHVAFSRMDGNGIWSVAFDALAAYFLARGLNRRRPFEVGLAGLCLGLGVEAAPSSWLFALVLALYLGHRFAFRRGDRGGASLVGLIALLVVFALTVSPSAEFLVTHPSVVESGLNHRSVAPDLAAGSALPSAVGHVGSYVSMFNYQGDPNARANFASWPELDQITGAIFVMGLVACLRRWKRSSYFFPILALVVMSLGGILAGAGGGPDSAWTIDNSLTCALIAAIPLGLLWSAMVEARFGRLAVPFRIAIPSLSTGAVLVLLLLAVISATDFRRYFVLQANDRATAAAFSTAPTLVAEAMRQLGTGDVYLSPELVDQPSIRFLGPRGSAVALFDPSTTLPLRDNRATAFFFVADDAADVGAVRAFYPGATLGTDRVSPDDPIAIYRVAVPPTEIDALQGLAAAFTPGRAAAAPPTLQRIDRKINFDWSTGTPLPVPFVGSWKGIIVAPTYGTYRFRLAGPTNASLNIDEREILRGASTASISLAQGRHRFALTVPFDDPEPLRLWWAVPGAPEAIVPVTAFFRAPATNRGLLATFYSNRSWSGSPELERIDVSPSQARFPATLGHPFSVNWTGKIDIPKTGLYRFGTQSIDFSWLYLDNKLVVDNSHGENQYVDQAVDLSAGLHDIRLSYLSQSANGFVAGSWQPPGYPREQLPPDRLFPPQGAYPDRAGPLAPPAAAIPTSPTAAPGNPIPSTTPAPGPLPISPLKIKLAFGAKGDGPGQLSDPRGIAVDGAGNAFVVDTGHQRVEEFSAQGQPIRAIGEGGAAVGQFQEPVAAVVNASGELAVLDATTGWISRFSPTGAYLGRFGGPTAGFYHPRGMALDLAGNYDVANTGSSQVDVFNPAGSLIRRLSDPTKVAGRQALQPVGVAVAPDGSLYVADAGNFLLIRYNLAFAELQTWALPSSDSVHGPHVALNAANDLYVTDPASHRVIHLGPDGKPRDQLGSGDQLSRPVGIATDASGNVYVVDSDADRVVVYGQ